MLHYLIYIFIFSLSLIYLTVILRAIRGWNKIKPPLSANPEKDFSIIIPFRNEEDTLETLLSALFSQEYPIHKHEILLIDDHSDDKSLQIIEQQMHKRSNLKIIQLPPNISGKKEAIKHGIKAASFNYIVTTDADCLMGKEWLSKINEQYQHSQCKMILGPVLYQESEAFAGKFQKIEFASLLGITAGFAGLKKPVMANGANMSYTKEVYQKYHSAGEKTASGDDVFLLHALKKDEPESVFFLKSKEAIVYTEASHTISSFFNQRKRWAGKTKFYKDSDTILLAMLIATYSASLLLSFLLIWLQPWLFLSLFATKVIIDYFFFKQISTFFELQKLLKYLIVFELIYFFYISITAICSINTKIYWKNRVTK